MGKKIKLIVLLGGVIFLYFIYRFIRKNTIRPSYSFLWVCISLFLLSIPILEPIYKWIATSIIGITDARHIVYIGLIIFLLIYVFYLTIEVCRMNDQIQELISYTAIIEKGSKKSEQEGAAPKDEKN